MDPFQLLSFSIILSAAVKGNIIKSGYHATSMCPTNANDWTSSSHRLNCNDTHKYHCAPYYDHSQLYEFCYARTVLKVEKGHCLGIAESGILNIDNCQFFSNGCPQQAYNSNELYKFPSCISIHGKCYTEDCVCNCLSESQSTKWQQDITSFAEKQNRNINFPLIFCVISVILNVILCIIICFLCRKIKQGKVKNVDFEEQEPLVPITEREDTHIFRTDHHSENEKHQIYEKTLVSYTIEDSEILRLLKRQCLNRTLSVFKYLVHSRVKSKNKHYIFKQCDENGCILLHFAAEGGSTLIVDEIFKIVSNDDILEYKSIRGETPLQFAIKYKQKEMTQHLIEKHSKRFKRLQQRAETTDSEAGRQENSRNVEYDITLATLENENTNEETGGLSPVHWAAWYGDVRLLHSLKQANFDISKKTRNGLNVLHIACLSDELKGHINFCRHLLDNESDKIVPMETDLCGWNFAHYASMSNKNLLELIAENEKLRCLIMENTASEKTCLHIACEFGKLEIVKFIVKKFKQLIHCVDNLGRNGLHFAAKGGNLEILIYLKENGLNLESLTFDNRTILHLACIHKNVEICQYAVDNFSKNLLNAKTKERGLTAAHYLGVESKGDRSEMKILEIFCNSEMNLTVLSKRGLSVLDRAIDQLNIELIEAMVSQQFREKCGIDVDELLKQQNSTDNAAIKDVLKMAIGDIKG